MEQGRSSHSPKPVPVIAVPGTENGTSGKGNEKHPQGGGLLWAQILTFLPFPKKVEDVGQVRLDQESAAGSKDYGG